MYVRSMCTCVADIIRNQLGINKTVTHVHDFAPVFSSSFFNLHLYSQNLRPPPSATRSWHLLSQNFILNFSLTLQQYKLYK